MNRTLIWLGGLLAAQILLALGLNFTGPSLASNRTRTPLIALGKGTVDRITLEGPDKTEVVLAKVGSAWQLPGEGNFPADSTRVSGLITSLEGLKEGLPVATSADARNRFKVSDDAFERRIALAAKGKTLATIYFGTAPSMREIHARRADQSNVYSVQFATYQVPTKIGDWEDKAILQVPRRDIDAIDVAGLHIAGDTLDTGAADHLAGLLADLRIGHVIGTTAPPAAGLDKPVLTLTLVKAAGQKIDYALGKAADGKSYTLKASTRPEYFALPTYVARAADRRGKARQAPCGPAREHA